MCVCVCKDFHKDYILILLSLEIDEIKRIEYQQHQNLFCDLARCVNQVSVTHLSECFWCEIGRYISSNPSLIHLSVHCLCLCVVLFCFVLCSQLLETTWLRLQTCLALVFRNLYCSIEAIAKFAASSSQKLSYLGPFFCGRSYSCE